MKNDFWSTLEFHHKSVYQRHLLPGETLGESLIQYDSEVGGFVQLVRIVKPKRASDRERRNLPQKQGTRVPNAGPR